MDLDIPRLFALQDRDNIFETIIADLNSTEPARLGKVR